MTTPILLCGSAFMLLLAVLFAALRSASLADDAMGVRETEQSIQERPGLMGIAVAWLVFHAVALWSSIWRWVRVKRVCSWHKPKQIWIGGNPFARRSTHGVCPECCEKQKAEIMSHAGATGTQRN